MARGKRGGNRYGRPFNFEKDEEPSPTDQRNARDPYSSGPKYANSPTAGWVDEQDAEYWKRQKGQSAPPKPEGAGQSSTQDSRKTAAPPPKPPKSGGGRKQSRRVGNPLGYVYSDGTAYDAKHDDGVQVVKPTYHEGQAAPPHTSGPKDINNDIPKQPSGSTGGRHQSNTGRPHRPPPRRGKAGWAVLGLVILMVGGIYWASTGGIQIEMDGAFMPVPEVVTDTAPGTEQFIDEMVDDLSGTITGMVEDPESITDTIVGLLPEAVGPYVLQVDDEPTDMHPTEDEQPQSPLDRTIWPTSPVTVPPEPDPEPTFIEQVEDRVHAMTNEHRAAHGARFLANDDRLDDIARNHSQDMADRGYFDHDTPEGLDPTDRGAAASYNCRKDYGSYYTYGLAENIFTVSMAVSNPEALAHQIVYSWMQSPGHRQNILEPTYDALGVGIAISQTGAVYATQNFC